MSSNLRSRLLSVAMLLLGTLMILGGTLSIFATSLFPFDSLAGSDTSVAGVAFGVGIAVAGFDPEAHVSWVRAAILYMLLVIFYRIVFGFSWGAWGEPAPLVIAIVFGVALAVLYPRRGELIPRAGPFPEGPAVEAAL